MPSTRSGRRIPIWSSGRCRRPCPVRGCTSSTCCGNGRCPRRAARVVLAAAGFFTTACRASAGLAGRRFAGRWSAGLPPVRLWVAADGQHAVIQVWDASDQLPVREAVPPDAETGRGLMLVESLADEWGSYTPEASSGKVVWAVISDGEPL